MPIGANSMRGRATLLPLPALPGGRKQRPAATTARHEGAGGRPPRSALYPGRKGLSVTALPKSIDETLALLASADYLADRSLATVLFLALRMGRPIFLEGEAGVGKTEIAKVLSATL